MKCPHCQTENIEDSRFCRHCARPLSAETESPEAGPTATMETPREELTTGSVFAGRYRIVEELGRGGMGRVYRARDTKLDEEVALKLLKPEIATDKKALARFSNELKIARGIVHKNIGRMYELMEEKGTSFITMEYVPGQDLKSLIRQTGILTVGKAVAVAKQVCHGLGEAHRQGVVHRDLKPQNIMIDKDGSARILDFGIAHSLKTKGITGARVMIGTPEYMSPEQVDGREVTPRSDIYALGAMLYEMLTARPPFEGDTAFTVGVKHKSEPPVDPREENPRIPEDLSRLIMKCLAKDPGDRYADTAEICRELSLIEQGLPTTERTTVSQRTPLTSREITVQLSVKKLLVPVLVFAAVIAAGIVLWRVLLPRPGAEALPPSDKPTLAVTYFRNNTGDKDLDIWRTALSDLLITDLMQSRHIRVLSTDRLYGLHKDLGLQNGGGYSSDDLKRIAASGGATHILQGSFSRAGESLRVSTVLTDAGTMESLGSQTVEGTGPESFHLLVDELTTRIKSGFHLTERQIASDIDREIGAITTASAEAYKFYTQGREYHHQLEYKLSIPVMEKALKIDPEFAMAYRSLAQSYNNLGSRYRDKFRENMDKALALTDRISERERYMIEGTHYGSDPETYDKAVEAYTRLLEIYPDAYPGRHNLAVIFGNMGEEEKAAEQYEYIIVEEGIENTLTVMNLMSVYYYLREYDKARSLIERYIASYPDSPRGYGHLSNVYLFTGDKERAAEEFEKAITLSPSYTWSGFHALEGKWELAEQELAEWAEGQGTEQARCQYLNWMEAYCRGQGRFEDGLDYLQQGLKYAEDAEYPYWTARFHLGFARLAAGRGDRETARVHIAKAEAVADEIDGNALKIGVFLWRVESLLGCGDRSGAAAAAEEMKSFVDSLPLAWLDPYLHYVQGRIEADRGNHEEAAKRFREAKTELGGEDSWGTLHALVFYRLAEAYYASGALDKARRELEAIRKLTAGRAYWEDLHARSYHMLGLIDQEQGNAAPARRNFERFLERWAEADEGLPEIEDARRRLAELE